VKYVWWEVADALMAFERSSASLSGFTPAGFVQQAATLQSAMSYRGQQLAAIERDVIRTSGVAIGANTC
jgi:hypothetical protein